MDAETEFVFACQLLDILQNLVICVTGNHGKATGGELEFIINWDLLSYKFMQAQMANQPIRLDK